MYSKTSLLIIVAVLIFIPTEQAHAIAPVLIPVFASALQILSGIILFISAPAIFLAASTAFFGLRITRNKQGKVQIHFNAKVFVINTSMMFIYLIATVAITFWLLQYKFNMKFMIAEQVKPRIFEDVMEGDIKEKIEYTRSSFSALFKSFFVLMIVSSIILSGIGESIKMFIFRKKIYFNIKIFLSDLLWFSLFTFLMIFIITAMIYFYYKPVFIV